MPAHIYVNTGRYEDAAKANENAIKVDETFFAKTREAGVYPVMYYTHNIHFLCYVQMMQGRGDDAMATARKLQAHLPTIAIRAMPMAEYMAPLALEVEARFGKWDAILQEPEPPTDLSYTDAMWHYARGLAFAAKKRFDDAEHERETVKAITAAVPADRPLGSSNSEKRVCELAIVVLSAKIASARGDHNAAAAKLGDAAQMQDALTYDEPPIWYFPVREELGTELLAAGEANRAEAVYRADLKINPGNPRSLKGLTETLRAQGKVSS
jgi:tetratricopeptide (TPR) repeat protein